MTAPNSTTLPIVSPVLVIWEVKQPGKKNARVTVTPNGVADCDCANWVLYGECDHVPAVQAERERRGLTRKH